MVPVALQLEQRSPSVRPATADPRPNPVARSDVLARLRDRSDRRPRFDPSLAGGLRAWLEDGASALVTARGESAPPLYLGPRLLLGQSARAAEPARAGRYSEQAVMSYLVHALFRQIVTSGVVGDPLTDALDALSLDPRRADLLRHLNSLDKQSRSALSAALRTQVGHLGDLTPAFSPGWLPRTDDRVAIPLAGGRIVLCGVFDLLVGAPVIGQASVCALQLTSGGPWAFARTALHYLALLETLRSGSPPYRLALVDSAVGRYVIEDVREAHLRAMVSHLVTRLSSLADA